MTDPVSLCVDVQNVVGESALWDERRGRLFWVDIVAKAIFSWDPASGDLTRARAPSLVTALGLRRDGGFVVALAKEVALWDGAESFATLAPLETEAPGNRLNEGAVGPDGAFWVGSMQNNIAEDGAPRAITESLGRLYRVTGDGGVTSLSDARFGITNTLVWAEGRLITADTLENAVYSFAIDPATHRLSDRRTIFAGFPRGYPDGSCRDAEGFVWTCRVAGGACLVRYSPDGALDRVVDLPCSWPTSCAFGGPELRTLYVTSARFTMSEAHLAAAPQEGGLFALDVGVAGNPPFRFGGSG